MEEKTKKTTATAGVGNAVKIYFKENLGIIVAFLVLCVFLSVFPKTSGSFFTRQNIFNVLRQISTNLFLACGMTMVIILGGIDLSVGSIIALSGCISAGCVATFNTQHEKIKEQYRSGAIDWKKYNSLFKKLQKEVNEEADNKRRALFGGGVSGLQDIYDAVSKGTFRDTGQVTYGHGSAYYTDRRRTNPNCSESLANYASLCVGHPELIDILAEDYPEIVTALRGCVEAMLKEVPK